MKALILHSSRRFPCPALLSRRCPPPRCESPRVWLFTSRRFRQPRDALLKAICKTPLVGLIQSPSVNESKLLKARTPPFQPGRLEPAESVHLRAFSLESNPSCAPADPWEQRLHLGFTGIPFARTRRSCISSPVRELNRSWTG